MIGRFDGFIAGLGTTAGVRLVVGHWPRSPFGAFTDVMVEQPDGHRLLLAPSAAVADFVAGTYRFDEVRVGAVTVSISRRTDGVRWEVDAPPLALAFRTGARAPLGRLLRLVPRGLAVRPGWIATVDVIARVVLPGVRTRGSAGGGREEFYGRAGPAPHHRGARHLGRCRPRRARGGGPAGPVRVRLDAARAVADPGRHAGPGRGPAAEVTRRRAHGVR